MVAGRKLEESSYAPPAGHTVAWVGVHTGTLLTPSPVSRGEVAIFEPGEGAIDSVAEGATGFVLGSAVKHPHELVLGNHSVHTSTRALLEGQAEIRRIGSRLLADGTLRPLT
jgi:hypothetical protein